MFGKVSVALDLRQYAQQDEHVATSFDVQSSTFKQSLLGRGNQAIDQVIDDDVLFHDALAEFAVVREQRVGRSRNSLSNQGKDLNRLGTEIIAQANNRRLARLIRVLGAKEPVHLPKASGSYTVSLGWNW